jgi:hypothetical protein
MSNPFEKMIINPGDVDKSITWYKKELQNLSRRDTSPNAFLTDRKNLTATIYPGSLYLFAYDPKLKNSLPFYDTFPMVFPFRKVKMGFYGYNLHYIPPVIRFKVMGILMNIQQSHDREQKKLANSYGVLNSSSLQKYLEPCIKHYLNNHVMSRFFEIPYDFWLPAALLPTERFLKASKPYVWKQSLGK